MAVRQLSIWDNVALEHGYRSLSELQFGKAIKWFQEASEGYADQKELQNALAACEFWQPKIQVQSEIRFEENKLETLIQDFTDYPFIRSLSGLKKALLLHLAERAGNAEKICLPLLEKLFDLLLALPDLQAAIQLVRRAIMQYPEKKDLLYLMAQVQWRDGNKTESKTNYIKACLLHPDEQYCKRMEIEEAIPLLAQNGVSWIPAYGWIKGFLPLISVSEEAAPLNENHRQAFTVYRLLRLSEEAVKKGDLKASVRYRKEIKTLKPDLYQDYFNLLQRRKGMPLSPGSSN